MKTIFLIAITAIALNACDSKKAAADSSNDPKSLNGSWELNYITFTRLSTKELYANKTPMINFNTQEGKVNGNTGCNSFTGTIAYVSAGKLAFGEDTAMTKMFCEGKGEDTFLEAFRKVKAFSFSDGGNTLHLTDGDIDLMRLTKK